MSVVSRNIIDKQLQYSSAEQEGVDIRNPSTAVLAIDSADRYRSNQDKWLNPTSPYQFTINSSQNLLAGFFTRIAVTEFSMTWSMPTITARNNSMWAEYSTGVTAPTAISAAAPDPGVLFTAVLTVASSAGFVIGQKARITGCANDLYNGIFDVTAVAAGQVKVLNPLISSGTATPNTPATTGGSVWTTAVDYVVKVVVPSAFYTPTTLAAATQSATILALNAVGVPAAAAFTIVLNADGTYTANTNTANTLFLYTPIYTSTGVGNSVVTTDLYQMMNWLPNWNRAYSITTRQSLDSIFTYSAASQKSGIPSMLSTKYIDIVCNQLTYNQSLKDASTAISTRDVLARIYLTTNEINTTPSTLGSTPFTLYRQFSTPKQIRWRPNQNIGSVTFELYDDAGNLLTTDEPTTNINTYITNSAQSDWQMTLLVSEV